MSKAWLIDTAARDIRAVEVTDSASMRHHVGGFIDLGHAFASGEMLYVDDEGLMKPQAHFFQFAPRADGWPLGGNGIVVGRELVNRRGEYTGTADVEIAEQSLRSLVRFMSLADVERWALTHANEPAMLMNGEVVKTVAQLYGPILTVAKRTEHGS
jgi:hypothetical protein